MDQVDRILAQWNRERPDLDVGPMGLLGRLKRVHDHVSRELAKVYATNGLNAASFDVLATLRRSGAPYALSPSELIQWTMVTSGTMTNRIDRLVEVGLVERRPNPADGRGFVIGLTGQGMKLIDRVIAEHVTNQHRLIDELPADILPLVDKSLREWILVCESRDAGLSDDGSKSLSVA